VDFFDFDFFVFANLLPSQTSLLLFLFLPMKKFKYFLRVILLHFFRGKFSVVKRAVNRKTGEEVAVKIINKRIVECEELVKEVAIMKEIDEHPGVIHLKDVYEDEKVFNLVMELYVVN
jgi:hypothetical protein